MYNIYIYHKKGHIIHDTCEIRLYTIFLWHKKGDSWAAGRHPESSEKPRSTGPGDVQQLVNLSVGNGGIYRYTIMIPEGIWNHISPISNSQKTKKNNYPPGKKTYPGWWDMWSFPGQDITNLSFKNLCFILVMGDYPNNPPKTSNFLHPLPTFFTNPRCGMWCESFCTLEMTEFSMFSTFTIRIVTNLSSANVPFDKIPDLGFRFRLESACLTIFVATRPFL